MNQHSGSALLSVLIVLTLIFPIGAFAVLESHVQSLMARNVRTRAAAFQAADAGLTQAVAVVEHHLHPDDLLAGPDQLSGTADDGMMQLAGVALAPSQHDYHVSIRREGDSVLRLTSIGRATEGGEAAVSALVRIAAPSSPATLVLDGPVRLASVSAEMQLQGHDDQSAASVPTVGLAQGASADPDAVEELGASNIQPIATLELAEWAERLRHSPATQLIASGEDVPTDLGTATSARLVFIQGDTTATGSYRGNGILVIDGNFRLRGELSYEGVLLVLGALESEAGSRLDVDGAVWVGARATAEVRLGGSGSVRYSSAELAHADSAFPGNLPRRANLVAWQELL